MFSYQEWESFSFLLGFRKVDPDRWEFANEGFLRGQKHLLRNINRRKPAHGHSNQQPQQSHGQSSVGACVEVGKFGLEEEVERLKRDKNVLMQELVRLRQQQQSTDTQLQTMVQRLQGMEQRQQQMMSFLAKAVQSPGFLAQFVQQKNESNRRISEANKKRRLKQEGIAENEHSAAPDGQIVKYQPLMNDAPQAMLRQILKVDNSAQMDSFNKNPDGFLIGDGSSSSIDSGSSSTRVSGVRLQEVPPTSGQSLPATSELTRHCPSAAISEIQSSSLPATSERVTTAPFPDISVLVGAQERPSIPLSQGDVVMPELSQMQEMVPDGAVDIPEDDYMGTETGDGFIPMSAGMNGSMSIEIDNFTPIDDIPPDPEIDALFENPSFWDEILVQSPVPDESTPAEEIPKGNEVQPTENGWDKVQHVDKLTEQMGLLASETKGV
ncbi:hypothetical protein FEM48_Zijuj11G0148500 [Ziziphus jujuba var. spinosa]|uniref:Heat shock factor protein HSF8-like n=1 Tax=Ziziphus jujuba var. spinosa TaxID=714518 RepID=A0A978UJK6_ZIZJJ|nr:hypothetical protein FEM48_Zijuj11G0148500 [Ziziphus jujuba var. spinosa]